MRRSCAVPLLLVLGAAGLLAAPTAASADTTVPTVGAQSWYWAEAGGTGPVPVGAPAQASGVPDGDLGVAYTNQVDKVAAVGLDVGTAPRGAVFSRYALSLRLDPAARQLSNGTPQLVACRALAPVAGGAAPGPLTDAPPVDTVSCVAGTFSAATSTYVFDLAATATDWAAGTPQDGVVVRPRDGDSTPFSASLLGGPRVVVAADYTVPAAAPATGTAPGAAPGGGPAVPAPAAGGAAPAAPAPFLPAPQGGGTLPDAGLPAVADPGPLAAPPAPVVPGVDAPQVAPGVPAPLQPVALPALSDLGPSRGVVLIGLALAALVALVSLVLGDPMAPRPLVTRRRRSIADVVGPARPSGLRPA